MIELLQGPPPTLSDLVVLYLQDQVPFGMVKDIVNSIFLTVLLICVDTWLRLLIEATNYNKATGRDGTTKNILLALVWRGWGAININGKNKRFLASKGLRLATFQKLVKQYPLFFLLSFISLIGPDTVIFSLRTDSLLSMFFMLIPICYEISSIVEKLQELDPSSINVLSKFISLVINLVKK